MIHYFGALAGVASVLLLATTWTGLSASTRHLGVGLAGSITAVAAHSLVIIFMIVTGRILREAIRARSLDAAFLAELNSFFEHRAAYPAALFAVLVTAFAAVLGFGQRAFALPAIVHPASGVVALVLNLISFSIELRTLAANQRLMDRAAEELDRIDRDLEQRVVMRDEPEGPDAVARLMRLAWTVMLGAWLPYLYQLLIVWKGSVSRVSLHPWIELSAVGLALLLLTRRERARAGRQDA